MAYLFDTSAWIEYFKDSKYSDKLEIFLEEEEELFTPTIVLSELSDVFFRNSKDLNEWKILFNFIKTKSEFVPINKEIATHAGIIKANKRKKHPSISLADCIVIATAKWTDANILTTDEHITDEESAINIKS